MRSRVKVDEHEIATRQRLRPVITYLHQQAILHKVVDQKVAANLALFMADDGYTFADLMALRERPHHYDHFHATQWEWFLRQCMNQHSQILATAPTIAALAEKLPTWRFEPYGGTGLIACHPPKPPSLDMWRQLTLLAYINGVCGPLYTVLNRLRP